MTVPGRNKGISVSVNFWKYLKKYLNSQIFATVFNCRYVAFADCKQQILVMSQLYIYLNDVADHGIKYQLVEFIAEVKQIGLKC